MDASNQLIQFDPPKVIFIPKHLITSKVSKRAIQLLKKKEKINLDKKASHKIDILSFVYNKEVIQYNHINEVFCVDEKSKNDRNNKLRETIIAAIINDKVPLNYYESSEEWRTMKKGIFEYIQEITGNIENQKIECIQKGGRKFNYDFDFVINDNETKMIEFKFNAETISDVPQFVSPMKPSKFLSMNFEEWYYDNYLTQISTEFSIPMPIKEEYLKQIHNPSPKCMTDYQQKYYAGCKNSSQYDKTHENINFHLYAKNKSKEALTEFIEKSDLDIEKMSEYLMNSQKGKVYMLYKNKKFHSQIVDVNNYKIVDYQKDPEKNTYIATLQNGKKIKILLRWKNGNGIAFPAFQIS